MSKPPEGAPEKAAKAQAGAKAQAEADADAGNVAMTLNGQTLLVNPACVADHQRLGWRLV